MKWNQWQFHLSKSAFWQPMCSGTFSASSLQTSSSSSHCRQWVTACRAPCGSSSTGSPPPSDTPVRSYRLISGRKGQSDGTVGPVSSGRRWELIHGLRPSRASRDDRTNGSRWARWVRKQPRIEGSWTQASLRRAPTVWRDGEGWCFVSPWSLSSPSSRASGPPLWPSLNTKETIKWSSAATIWWNCAIAIIMYERYCDLLLQQPYIKYMVLVVFLI